MFKKLKNSKGFTFVEIIVVLAIISILAAIAIPSVTGYVNSAKQQGYISNARAAYSAAVYNEHISPSIESSVSGTYTACNNSATSCPSGSAHKDKFTCPQAYYTETNTDGTFVVKLFDTDGVLVTKK